MLRAAEPAVNANDLIRTLTRYPWRIALPTILVTAAAVAYAILRQPTWEATQAVLVLNDASAAATGPGKFQHPEEMKSSQETILELALSRDVLLKVLKVVGPPSERTTADPWPTDLEIDDFRASIKLTPPKGAEFGKTEIFYLKARNHDRGRAIHLVAALSEQLKRGAGALRDAKAASMLSELNQTVVLAESDLDQATKRLVQLEKQVGGDLVDLRILHVSPGGEGDLNRTQVDAHNELRQARVNQNVSRQVAELLAEAQKNPTALLAAPAIVFESQPALRRLKDGLVDAQLRTASLLGGMTPGHPLVMASRQAENLIHEEIVREVKIAARSVQSEIQLCGGRVDVLEDHLVSLDGRMRRLAEVRAEYSNLASRVDHRQGLLEAAEQRLADVRASQAVARDSSPITCVGEPDGGVRPVGPGKTAICLGGLFGGLMAGLAWVLISVPWPTSSDGSTPLRRGSMPGGSAESHRNGPGGAIGVASHHSPLDSRSADESRLCEPVLATTGAE